MQIQFLMTDSAYSPLVLKTCFEKQSALLQTFSETNEINKEYTQEALHFVEIMAAVSAVSCYTCQDSIEKLTTTKLSIQTLNSIYFPTFSTKMFWYKRKLLILKA